MPHHITCDWQEDVPVPDWEPQIFSALDCFLSELFAGDRSVALYVTTDQEMRDLNREHRGKDRTTDVLSWSYYETDEAAEHVGDLALSWEQVSRQATENGWDVRTECLRMLAHGCAHLAGWDHERSQAEAQAMLAVEVRLLQSIGLPDLYT
jgi:probable rRNA maturation factor